MFGFGKGPAKNPREKFVRSKCGHLDEATLVEYYVYNEISLKAIALAKEKFDAAGVSEDEKNEILYNHLTNYVTIGDNHPAKRTTLSIPIDEIRRRQKYGLWNGAADLMSYLPSNFYEEVELEANRIVNA